MFCKEKTDDLAINPHVKPVITSFHVNLHKRMICLSRVYAQFQCDALLWCITYIKNNSSGTSTFFHRMKPQKNTKDFCFPVTLLIFCYFHLYILRFEGNHRVVCTFFYIYKNLILYFLLSLQT